MGAFHSSEGVNSADSPGHARVSRPGDRRAPRSLRRSLCGPDGHPGPHSTHLTEPDQAGPPDGRPACLQLTEACRIKLPDIGDTWISDYDGVSHASFTATAADQAKDVGGRPPLAARALLARIQSGRRAGPWWRGARSGNPQRWRWSLRVASGSRGPAAQQVVDGLGSAIVTPLAGVVVHRSRTTCLQALREPLKTRITPSEGCRPRASWSAGRQPAPLLSGELNQPVGGGLLVHHRRETGHRGCTGAPETTPQDACRTRRSAQPFSDWALAGGMDEAGLAPRCSRVSAVCPCHTSEFA